MASYTKLKSGEWGIRIEGGSPPAPGTTVTVTKKSGESKTETVAKVVWSGNGIHLCAVGASNGSYTPTAGASGERKCSSCGVRESSLRKPYEVMLRNGYCSPCWKEEKDGYGD